MTQEEKLQEAKRLYKSANADQKYVLESLFPELKENEDERVRNFLIGYFDKLVDENSEWGLTKETRSRIIAWLEKQGEKPTLPKWKYKKDNTPLLRDSLILNKYGCVAKSPSGALVSDVWVIDYDELAKLPKEEIEKQGEKRPADKTEPKFKVGDWVVYTGYLLKDSGKEIYVMQVASVENDRYIFTDTSTLCFDSEKDMRLWTIQDAKDGDVLYSPTHILIWIYKDNEHYYAAINLNYVNDVSFDNEIVIPSDVRPANRAQKSIFFQKLEEAGYEWDTEKKELRKFPTPADVGFEELGKAWAEEAKDKKPAWSEEDSPYYDDIYEMLINLLHSETANVNKNAVQKDLEWLKSLKDRIQPKLKQEWKQENTGDLTDFENAMMHIGGSFFGQHQGLDPNDTSVVKEQAKLLLELIPSKEWSEEDERIRQDIENLIHFALRDGSAVSPAADTTKEDAISWIQSLRPQKTWKPSDEQIKVCRKVYADLLFAKGFDLGAVNSELNRMEEQLNKLREE